MSAFDTKDGRPRRVPASGLVWNVREQLDGSTVRLNTLLGTLIDPDDPRDPTDVPAIPGMSVHLVRFGPGEDVQTPHRQDEVYYVIRGRAKMTYGRTENDPDRGGETVDVGPGSLIFISACTQHCFHDFEPNDDGVRQIETLVVFAPNYTR